MRPGYLRGFLGFGELSVENRNKQRQVFEAKLKRDLDAIQGKNQKQILKRSIRFLQNTLRQEQVSNRDRKLKEDIINSIKSKIEKFKNKLQHLLSKT